LRFDVEQDLAAGNLILMRDTIIDGKCTASLARSCCWMSGIGRPCKAPIEKPPIHLAGQPHQRMAQIDDLL